MKLAIAILLLSGCDKLFGLTPIGYGIGSGSGLVDAMGSGSPSIDSAMIDTPWVCAPPPMIPLWTGSNFSVVGSYPTTTHPTADVVAAKFYFATAGDLEQCNLGVNLRNADTCSVVLSLSGTTAETAPSLSADNLTMYFDRAGAAMQSTRTAAGAWLNATPMTLPNTLAMAEVGAPSTATEHGVRMLLSDGGDLHEAAYTTATGWVEVLNTLTMIDAPASNEVDPYLSPDGCWMVYASNASGNYDLYFATRSPDGAFATPTPLTMINNDVTDDCGPFVANEQILYYTRGNNLQVAEPP